MSNFQFSSRSLLNLETCHPKLIQVAQKALSVSPYDFGITEGHRSTERQKELYDTVDAAGNRLTLIDGIKKKGNHNYSPSRAFDFLPSGNVNGLPVWQDVQRFSVIAGVILATGNSMGVGLRWGGDWDGDGNAKDQQLYDLPHIELTEGWS